MTGHVNTDDTAMSVSMLQPARLMYDLGRKVEWNLEESA